MFTWKKKLFYWLLFASSILFSSIIYAENSIRIPILCYHNFNPKIPGSMTMTPEKFEAEIKWLKENGFTFVPLKDVVAYLLGKRESLPAKPIVVSADDGWKSAYTYMYPIVKKYNIPVTLFIYPQAIASSKNKMTWEELKELQGTGLFDIQGHTYTHPNFKQDKRRLSAANFEKYVKHELYDSKKILEEKMGTPVTLLAWPFGIYNDYLEQQAAKAGYVMAFSIDDRKADTHDKPMAQPRFMILQGLTMKTFAAKMGGAAIKSASQ